MGVIGWALTHWLDLLQSLGIISGFCFTAYTIRKDEQARKIGNMLGVAEQHRQLWRGLYDRPKLSRVLRSDVDLQKKPISDDEEVFVSLLILHLENVYRTAQAGMFVTLQGIDDDIREFFMLPIPNAVWGKIKKLQNADFISYVDSRIPVSN